MMTNLAAMEAPSSRYHCEGQNTLNRDFIEDEGIHERPVAHGK